MCFNLIRIQDKENKKIEKKQLKLKKLIELITYAVM